jgi:hypothetical protein
MLLINEWARGAAYVRPTDGGPAIRLGDGTARALSPDGKSALVSRPSPFRFVLLPTGPGQAREYPLGNLSMERVGEAAFLPGSKGVVFRATSPGRPARSYLLDIETATIRPLTEERTSGIRVSPDGRWLLVKGREGFAFHPLVAGSPARPAAGLEAGDAPIRFSSDGQSVFVQRLDGPGVKVFSVEVATGARKLVREFRPVDPAGVLGPGQVDLTPDARFWVHGYMRDLSDFYVVDGLK